MANRIWSVISAEWANEAAIRRRLHDAARWATTDRAQAQAAFAVGSVVLVGLLRLLFLAGTRPATPGEGTTLADAFAVGHGGWPGIGTTPVCSLQLAGFGWVTGAFDSAATATTAMRGAMVVTAVVGAALVWVLARRLDVSPGAASAAVLVLAVSPLVIGVQRLVLPENVAAPWLLAGLVLLCGKRAEPLWRTDIAAGVCLLIAALTAPLSLAMLPAAVLLVVRRGRPVRLLVLAPAFAAGVAAGVRVPFALTGGAGLAGWLGYDPVLPVVAALAAVIGCFVARLRPVAVGALVVAAAIPWLPAGGLALLLPVGCLLVAGVVDTGLHALAPGRHARARHAAGHRSAVTVGVVTVLLIAAAIPGWVYGAGRLGTGSSAERAVHGAMNWLRGNAGGGRLLADDAAWVELRTAGWSAGTVSRRSACAAACPAARWLVTSTPPPAGAEAVAAFDNVRISRTGLLSDPATAAAERQARRAAGTALAPLAVTGQVAGLLRNGQVDPRILITVAGLQSLATAQEVRILRLPAVPGEDAAGQPRRTLLLDVAGVPADDFVRFFAQQQGVYHPQAAAATPDGVLVRYPPVAPTGLLTAFGPH